MREIDVTKFEPYLGRPVSQSLGIKPGLAWIPVASLRIDPAYQREILKNGAKNVIKIARNFDWSLFGIVVVANIGDGLFAVVDGQHRTLGAALRDVREVPCIIIEADPEKQAKAFAAINGAVTAISPLAIFSAEVAANVPEALAVRDACKAAGVTICRYPVPSNSMKPGETIAVRSIQECMKTYGSDHLSVSLKCIRLSVGMKGGLLRAPIIKAVCHVLEAQKSFMIPQYRLVAAITAYDIEAEFLQAETDARAKRQSSHTAFAKRLFNYLDEEIGG